MQVKTTTREYDAQGNLTKETIVETDTTVGVGTCTCYGPWGTLRWCQLHGYSARTIHVSNTSIAAAPTITHSAVANLTPLARG